MNIGKVGGAGEKAAEKYLRRGGFKIAARNYQCRWGEIDIVCERGGFIVFVEVKTRRVGALVGALESVGAAKRRRLTAAAENYLLENETQLQPRFDVIEVVHDGDNYFVGGHIENAF